MAAKKQSEVLGWIGEFLNYDWWKKAKQVTPLFRNTFSNACARLRADTTDSINRLSTAAQVAGSIRPLPFAVCTKNRFP